MCRLASLKFLISNFIWIPNIMKQSSVYSSLFFLSFQPLSILPQTFHPFSILTVLSNSSTFSIFKRRRELHTRDSLPIQEQVSWVILPASSQVTPKTIFLLAFHTNSFTCLHLPCCLVSPGISVYQSFPCPISSPSSCSGLKYGAQHTLVPLCL